MRPLKLEFTAFGPYPTTQVIDFTTMQNSNMFVITGPTGSGKTTIFDAMSFALYGSASGSDRTTDMFRSDFADNNLTTVVDFEFTVQNKMYKITRTPAQYRPKLRGEGMRKVESSVKLQFDDTVLTAQAEVAAKLEQVLGLTKDQFKQIVLLPQGEFKKLLVSNSREKEEIFRKIFNTSYIKQIQEELRIQSSHLKREIEDSELQIETILSAYPNTTGLPQLERLYNSTTANTSQLQLHVQAVEQATIELNLQIEKQAEHQDNVQQLNDVQTKLNNYVANQATYQNYANFIDNLPVIVNFSKMQADNLNLEQKATKLVAHIEQLKLSKNAIARQVTENTEKYVIIDQQFQTIEQLKVELANGQDQLALIDTVKQLIIQSEQYQKSIDAYSEQYQALDDKQTELAKQLATAIDNQQQQEQIVEQINQVTTKLELVKEQLAATQQVDVIQQQVELHIEQSNALNNQVQELSNKLTIERNKYLTAQAGTLAQNLTYGQPCPVCGSTDHPKLATSNEQSLNLDQLNDLDVELANKTTKLNKLLSTIEVDKVKIASLTTQHQLTDVDYQQLLEATNQQLVTYQNQHTKLAAMQTVTELQTVVEQVTDQQQIIKIELEKYKFSLNENQAKIANFNVDINLETALVASTKGLEKQIKDITTSHEQLKTSIFELQHDVKQAGLEIKLEEQNLTQLSNEQQANIETINEIKKAIGTDQLVVYLDMLPIESEIRQKYNQYLTDFALLESQVTTLKQKIAQYKPINLELVKEQLVFKTAEGTIYSELLDTFKAYSSRLATDINSLQVIDRAVGQMIKKYQTIADVSDIANGKSTSKISFERYMLSIYFKQIIERANIYFKTMTNNRFELEYRDAQSRKGPQGLDLNIIDNYTTKVRDVKSLSGGESFKAALAMALGLSDIVQMNSGGIQIDTIFIDEGFGSLDIDSLNSAIDTLISIETEGRMVGIISHVEELKNQISNKIEIKPSPSGSSLVTHFN